MGDRVYVFLEVVNGKSDCVAQALRDRPGVMIADRLEGRPEVIIVVEASERQELAELTMRAIASVDTMVENLYLLPAQDRSNRLEPRI